MNIEVGQILYKWDLQEMIVTRIGNKYFYVKDKRYNWDKEIPIEKNSLKHIEKDYNQHNFQLYRNQQEILDEKEHFKLCGILYKYFIDRSSVKCSLENLRQIVEILKLN